MFSSSSDKSRKLCSNDQENIIPEEKIFLWFQLSFKQARC